ncbi:SOD [Plodia interpunctella granulovirus]|uniref:superoxide dismutase n=1 Tax=Plodia interpunctella granulovirus TaxID=262175 RepID=A0A1L5JGM6_9BBAC|nr:SOD [Plodia interpunctella granulovirus]APO13935.1 SOD [Plodia interpunctella granulovirus]
MKGLCILTGDVEGEVEFWQDKPSMPMRILGFVRNLPRGNHGIHIHEFGDTTNGCTSAGEHFNPHHRDHGGPNSAERHLGDLGNIYSRGEHVATPIDRIDPMISLYGPYNILGRSLVIHAMEDDYGRGSNELSKITGNAGSRLGCGVIGVKREKTIGIGDDKVVSSSTNHKC